FIVSESKDRGAVHGSISRGVLQSVQYSGAQLGEHVERDSEPPAIREDSQRHESAEYPVGLAADFLARRLALQVTGALCGTARPCGFRTHFRIENTLPTIEMTASPITTYSTSGRSAIRKI